MHTHMGSNLRRKLRKPLPRRWPLIKTPGQLLLQRAEEANEAARVSQNDELLPHQGPTP
ncbi:hypothetical protein D9M68_398510 [compost metagenome]